MIWYSGFDEFELAEARFYAGQSLVTGGWSGRLGSLGATFYRGSRARPVMTEGYRLQVSNYLYSHLILHSKASFQGKNQQHRQRRHGILSSRKDPILPSSCTHFRSPPSPPFLIHPQIKPHPSSPLHLPTIPIKRHDRRRGRPRILIPRHLHTNICRIARPGRDIELAEPGLVIAAPAPGGLETQDAAVVFAVGARVDDVVQGVCAAEDAAV